MPEVKITAEVERVAKAAFDEAAKVEHEFWFSSMRWEDMQPDFQKSFRACAIAALEALMEPSMRQIQAGIAAGYDSSPADFHDMPRDVIVSLALPVYRAMLRSALGTPEPPVSNT